MKGSIRRKGKTQSYRVYVSTVDGQNKQIEKGGFKTKNMVCYYEQTGVSKRKELTDEETKRIAGCMNLKRKYFKIEQTISTITNPFLKRNSPKW